jgi:3-deoxy-D-manno-octulosonate 8-phosphate phosphatase (KDO 8-P phosphatase)
MELNPPFNEKILMEKAAGIQVLLMDVDGVLTDGRLFLVPNEKGELVETKGFTAQDGIALRWLTWYGVRTGVISGRDSPATRERARQVGMSWVHQGHIEKIPLFEEIVREANVSPLQVAYVGDDLTDVVLFRRAGLAFATANARPEVKRAAHAITASAGGEGAVREVIELLLQAKGVWSELLKKYEVIP